MTTLIVVGLLIVGIAALVGLVVVLRSEGRRAPVNTSPAERGTLPAAARRDDADVVEGQAREEPASETTPVVAPPEPEMDSTTRPVTTPTSAFTEDRTTATQPVPSPTPSTTPSYGEAGYYQGVPEEQHSVVRLNGHFRELASELRSLYREAGEIKDRLSALNDMISDIERQQHYTDPDR